VHCRFSVSLRLPCIDIVFIKEIRLFSRCRKYFRKCSVLRVYYSSMLGCRVLLVRQRLLHCWLLEAAVLRLPGRVMKLSMDMLCRSLSHTAQTRCLTICTLDNILSWFLYTMVERRYIEICQNIQFLLF